MFVDLQTLQVVLGLFWLPS